MSKHDRRWFLGGALSLSILERAIASFERKYPELPRLKSDAPRLKVGDPGSENCRILCAYTGKDVTHEDFTEVDCELGWVEKHSRPPRWRGHNLERVRTRRWVVVRLGEEEQ